VEFPFFSRFAGPTGLHLQRIAKEPSAKTIIYPGMQAGIKNAALMKSAAFLSTHKAQ
jgi:hypothetical protein